MLTPQQIESLADAVIDAYQEFDTSLRAAAARGIADAGIELDREKVKAAIAAAGTPDDIAAAIMATYTQAAALSLAQEATIYGAARAAGIIATFGGAADEMMVRNIVTQGITTAINAHNLVATTAVGAVQTELAYILDRAMLSVATGAQTQEQAVAWAVDNLAKGQTRVTYVSASGTVRNDTLYTAVRRSIVTGTNQMSARITDARIQRYGVEYVEVSAHAGARLEHAEWQGQVYLYRDLGEKCGYGAVDGLEGANCRHSHQPFFPGINEPTDYTGLERLDNDEEYRLSQRQRLCERNVRMYRSREDIYLAGGQAEAAGKARRLRDKWYAEGEAVAAARRDFPRLNRMVPFPGEARW